ncbi:hypothetical protein KR215_008353, partial [Drosophila sulfurigaster]
RKASEFHIAFEKLIIFECLDNQLDSAKEYAHWLVSNMEVSWKGSLVQSLLG